MVIGRTWRTNTSVSEAVSEVLLRKGIVQPALSQCDARIKEEQA